MSEPVRKGQFPQGKSGNPRGRPKSPKRRLDTPEALDEVIIDVMNMPTTIRTPSGEETVSLFRATMLRLATGKAENRLAAVHAIQLMRQAVWSYKHRVEQEEKQRQYLKERAMRSAIQSEYG